LIQQDLDKVEFGVAQRAHDAAAIKFFRGPDALYVAIRVVDADVIGADPNAKDAFVDSVALTLDVRPRTAGAWAASMASDGLYRLRISAPTRPGTPVWMQSNEEQKAIGRFEIMARPLSDGYAIEARISLSSLAVGDDRSFDRPLGFDVMVLDVDGRGDAVVSQAYC
jgi:hypothetical protein